MINLECPNVAGRQDMQPNLPALAWQSSLWAHLINRNLISLTQPIHHYYSHTHTQIILVCVKIKFNSSFKGQAHQTWEPGKTKLPSSMKTKNPEKLQLTLSPSFSISSRRPFSLLTCTMFWEGSREGKKMLSDVKDIRLKHECKPLICLWGADNQLTPSATMCVTYGT